MNPRNSLIRICLPNVWEEESHGLFRCLDHRASLRTLVELFTEKDCWERKIQKAAAGKDSDGSDSDIKASVAVTKRKECLRSQESLPTTITASLQDILKDCFKYETAMRARAIDIVNAFF